MTRRKFCAGFFFRKRAVGQADIGKCPTGVPWLSKFLSFFGSVNNPPWRHPATPSVGGSCLEKHLPGRWQFRAGSAGLATIGSLADEKMVYFLS